MTKIVAKIGSAADKAAVAGITLRRTKISFILTGILLFFYLGFMLLVAYAKQWLATQVIDGLSLALILGALVIVGAWLLAWFYVTWANKHHDTACDQLAGGRGP